MPKFSGPESRATAPRAPVQTTSTRAVTEQGGLGYERELKSELYLLAVANMAGEDTFYELKQDRDHRFRELVHVVTMEDPAWVAAFVPYLRGVMQMRSAAVVMAAEYVVAGGPNGRAVVDSAILRGDEPAELLAYWVAQYGRKVPKPVKRGLTDAVLRVYNERSALRYDGQSRGWRMGDVIEIIHPKPKAPWQSELFRFLLDERHHPGTHVERADDLGPLLGVIRENRSWHRVPVNKRRDWLHAHGADGLARAGVSWEALSGWLQGPMDAAAWEAVIPSMGYMALLRNLRNFEEAGISPVAQQSIIATLTDPEMVARSRQFPLRFYSAYKATGSTLWAHPLEQALELSLGNVPRLPGRSLVLIDVSVSMLNEMSGRSEAQRWEIATVFGAAFAKAQKHADVYLFSDQHERLDVRPSVLRTVEDVGALFRTPNVHYQGHRLGGNTLTAQALHATFDGHDRVLILTDEQAADAHLFGPIMATAGGSRFYTWNLAGYRVAQSEQGMAGSYAFGGLTDTAFRTLELLEGRGHDSWPFVG